MPIYDYQCTKCETIDERFAGVDEKTLPCKCCGELARRVYLKLSTTHDAPSWLKDTLEVVDKEGGPHCQEFLKRPTRSNYKKWMKGEGIRPMDHGESTKVGIPKEEKIKKRAKTRHKLQEAFRSREAISIK